MYIKKYVGGTDIDPTVIMEAQFGDSKPIKDFVGETFDIKHVLPFRIKTDDDEYNEIVYITSNGNYRSGSESLYRSYEEVFDFACDNDVKDIKYKLIEKESKNNVNPFMKFVPVF